MEAISQGPQTRPSRRFDAFGIPALEDKAGTRLALHSTKENDGNEVDLPTTMSFALFRHGDEGCSIGTVRNCSRYLGPGRLLSTRSEGVSVALRYNFLAVLCCAVLASAMIQATRRPLWEAMAIKSRPSRVSTYPILHGKYSLWRPTPFQYAEEHFPAMSKPMLVVSTR